MKPKIKLSSFEAQYQVLKPKIKLSSFEARDQVLKLKGQGHTKELNGDQIWSILLSFVDLFWNNLARLYGTCRRHYSGFPGSNSNLVLREFFLAQEINLRGFT